MKPPISLERYRRCVNAIHSAMKSTDGMTVHDLHKTTGFAKSTIYAALAENPLFYVDRWQITRKIYMTQVWYTSAPERIENCPRPEMKK